MHSPLHPLRTDDVLELSAALAGLSRVHQRFLIMTAPRPGPDRARRAEAESGARHMTALARAGLYNVLAATFAGPPTDEVVHGLRDGGAIEALIAKGIGGEDLRRWAHTLPEKDVASELTEAFSQVFVRSGARSAALLESAYREGPSDGSEAAGGMSHGAAAEAVVAAYQRAGLVVGGEGPATPQHLSVEFQFLHHCAACEAAAWADADPLGAEIYRNHQAAFVVQHLGVWIDLFAERLSQVGAHPYYRAMAELGARFLAGEQAALTSAGSLDSSQPRGGIVAAAP